jgi:hypothetical protein
VLVLGVERIQPKTGRLQAWITLENKTDKTLDLHYNSFVVDAGGTRSTGALKAGMIRMDKGFPMPPRFLKKAHIEFLDVPFLPEVTMTLSNIRTQGEEGASELSLPVPVDDGTSRR